MSNIEKQNLINEASLKSSYYFESVLQEAYNNNLLTDLELERIQIQSIKLSASQFELYTDGQSSSIKEETASNIMKSIFFAIGLYLKSFTSINTTIETLKEKTLSDLFLKGKKLIEEEFHLGQQLLQKLQNNCIITDNYAYNETIHEGLPLFFSAYDIDFAAHETPGSIDYPVCDNNINSVGIEYINSYLKILFVENQFCNNFSSTDINCMLEGYSKNYQNLLINIFELTLSNIVGCSLAGKDVYPLNVELEDKEYLYNKMKQLPQNELNILLEDSAMQICTSFSVSDKLLEKHITKTVSNLSPRLKNAIENNNLDSIFISFADSNTQKGFLFEDGKKMDDKSFRKVSEEIRDCRYIWDKIAIIKAEIHSMADLVSILESYCIFDGEFSAVFQSLDDIQLALLLKKIPAYIIDTDFHFTECEKEWYSQLNNYLDSLDINKRNKVKAISRSINGNL